VPGRFGKYRQFANIFEHTSPGPVKADNIARVRPIEIQLDISLSRRLPDQLMQQSSLELSRLDFEFGPGSAVDNLDLHSRRAYAIAQLRSQIPLQLFTTELFNPRQQWPNRQFCAPISK